MHVTGLLGMPRRVYTYPDGMGWDLLNLIETIGGAIFAVGVLLFFINALKSWRGGAEAGPNPWDAPTLEWATSSPPPPYNFAVIPTVASRHPLWEDSLEEGEGRSSIQRGMTLDDGKEALSTTPMDAEPERIVKMPEDSYAPFLLTLALALLFTAMLLKLAIMIAIAVVAVIAALLLWLWPRRELLEREPAHG
jgi:ABC-type antimicrobial peptide transport system permease subunit